jgi:hypothetical protein
MKKLFVIAALSFSLNALAQSYMVLGGGVVLTVDKQGQVFDLNHFILPYKITLTGGQFLAEDDRFVTIDDKGFLYRKEEKVPKNIQGKGLNYILSERGRLTTIDDAGFFYEYDKESVFKKARMFGGNFFVVDIDEKKGLADLYTLNSKGNFFKINVPNLNPSLITVAGGRYFQTRNGVVSTVSKDGFVFTKPDIKVGAIKKMGGNFFIDSNNLIFTVSEDGLLLLPLIPNGLEISSLTKLGNNYFIDGRGKLFTVDNLGQITEREIKSHDINDVKILAK